MKNISRPKPTETQLQQTDDDRIHFMATIKLMLTRGNCVMVNPRDILKDPKGLTGERVEQAIFNIVISTYITASTGILDNTKQHPSKDC